MKLCLEKLGDRNLIIALLKAENVLKINSLSSLRNRIAGNENGLPFVYEQQ